MISSLRSKRRNISKEMVIHPPRIKNLTRIVSTRGPKLSPKATPIRANQPRSWYGTVYEGSKALSKGFGYYSRIEPFLPDERIRKIHTQPVSSAIEFDRFARKIFKKKKQFSQGYRKFYQECGEFRCWNNRRFTGASFS